MQSGDLVKYVGSGWPREGTLGIILATLGAPRIGNHDCTIKVHWSAKSGGEASWEDPRSLEPAAVTEIYFK